MCTVCSVCVYVPLSFTQVNLDGETNLKPRRPALPQGMLAAASGNDEAQQGNRPAAGDDGPEAQPSGRQGGGQLCPAPGTCSSPHDAALQAAIKGLLQLEGVIECEAPNANMHKFHGSINVQPAGTSTATDTEDTDAPASAPGDMPAPAPLAAGVQGVQAQAPAARPVTMGEVLLRGSELRNSIWAVGLVVYAGPDTRVQLNAARPPLKARPWQQPGFACLLECVPCVLLRCLACGGSLSCAPGAWCAGGVSRPRPERPHRRAHRVPARAVGHHGGGGLRVARAAGRPHPAAAPGTWGGVTGAHAATFTERFSILLVLRCIGTAA